jgi:hypothetical protein
MKKSVIVYHYQHEMKALQPELTKLKAQNAELARSLPAAAPSAQLNHFADSAILPCANPWKKATFNLSRLSQISRDNPALAARLEQEAGNS